MTGKVWRCTESVGAAVGASYEKEKIAKDQFLGQIGCICFSSEQCPKFSRCALHSLEHQVLIILVRMSDKICHFMRLNYVDLDKLLVFYASLLLLFYLLILSLFAANGWNFFTLIIIILSFARRCWSIFSSLAELQTSMLLKKWVQQELLIVSYLHIAGIWVLFYSSQHSTTFSLKTWNQFLCLFRTRTRGVVLQDSGDEEDN